MVLILRKEIPNLRRLIGLRVEGHEGIDLCKGLDCDIIVALRLLEIRVGHLRLNDISERWLREEDDTIALGRVP